MINFCRTNCKNLKPKEKEQSRFLEPHDCIRYSKKVYHGPYHPQLIKLNECK